jgi:hypothetical protein
MIYRIGCAGDHVFHKACINRWFLGHETCPTCRANVVNPLPIIRGDLAKQQQWMPSYSELVPMMHFIRDNLERDDSLRAHMFFSTATMHLDEVIYWERHENADDIVAYIYTDRVFQRVILRWW